MLRARTTPAVSRHADHQLEALTNATPAQWKHALAREQLVLRILASAKPITETVAMLAFRERIGARTLMRWVARYRDWPHTSALLDRRRGNRSGAQRLTPAIESLIFNVIDDLYLARPKGTIEAVYQEVRARCRLRRLKTPSRNAVTGRIKALDPQLVARRQLGAKEAKRTLGSTPGTLAVNEPLATVQIDHTLVDMIVVDDAHCVMGFYLSLETTFATSVAACIAHACLPKDKWIIDNNIDVSWPLWSLPRKLHVDNAREFKSEALQRGCAEHGIEIVLRSVACPHYGGHIERQIYNGSPLLPP
jgi:putative transposase